MTKQSLSEFLPLLVVVIVAIVGSLVILSPFTPSETKVGQAAKGEITKVGGNPQYSEISWKEERSEAYNYPSLSSQDSTEISAFVPNKNWFKGMYNSRFDEEDNPPEEETPEEKAKRIESIKEELGYWEDYWKKVEDNYDFFEDNVGGKLDKFKPDPAKFKNDPHGLARAQANYDQIVKHIKEDKLPRWIGDASFKEPEIATDSWSLGQLLSLGSIADGSVSGDAFVFFPTYQSLEEKQQAAISKLSDINTALDGTALGGVPGVSDITESSVAICERTPP
ncbi:hypothetical protein J4410_04065 [Candidatus Woesearchaeota archaeon]|nr:hypothetical protein [Candidatus Woesearchaeota archaeon]